MFLFCYYQVVSKLKLAEEKHGDSLKKKTAFSACDDFQRSLPCPVGANVLDGTSNRSPRGLDETPECVKDEGRLKPPFAGNVDIPLAGARRLISRPRKA